MLDIGNNLGNGSKCRCGAKEEIEHLILCHKRKIGTGNVNWWKETENIEIVRRMNKWIEKCIEIREGDSRKGGDDAQERK